MVTLTLDGQAHLVTMVSSFALLLKFAFTLAIQGGKRFPAGTRPPEDAALKRLAKGTPQSYGLTPVGKEDDPKVKRFKEADVRWQRVVLNDLESIPITLIIAWASLLSPWSAKAHSLLVITYTVARVLHTVAYANSLQPHRTIAWFVGVLSMVLLGVNGVVGVALSH